MPSLAKTLRRCHSTVRGLRKSWAPISGFVYPVGRHPRRSASPAASGRRASRRCACARSRRWPAARGGRARRTARCPCRRTARARRGAARARRRGGSRAAATRRRGAARGPAPMRMRVRRQPLDRLAVEPLGGVALGEHAPRERARRPSAPVGAVGLGDLGEPRERAGGALRLAAADGGLDRARPPPRSRGRSRQVLGGALERGQRVVVAAERVVEDRGPPVVGGRARALRRG